MEKIKSVILFYSPVCRISGRIALFTFFAWVFLVSSTPSLQAQTRYSSFLVSSNQKMTGAVECPFISFQTWDGSIWTAWITGDKIISAPAGNTLLARSGGPIRYINPEGEPVEAKLVSGKLVHTLKSESSPIATNDSINFKCWEGQTLFARMLPPAVSQNSPVETAAAHDGPRFSSSNDEITDWKTNLIWKEGPDKDTSYSEAQSWIKSLGQPWRSPSHSELKDLFNRGDGGGLKGNMPAEFPKMDGTVIWAEENDPSTGWYVGFIYGNVYTLEKGKSRFARALAVRPR